MGDKLIRESLDEYAALNTPPQADLWPRLMSQLPAARPPTQPQLQGWVPQEEKELTWVSIANAVRSDTRGGSTGRRAFVATTVTSLATLLLVIIGTLGLLSAMSSAPNKGESRLGSIPSAETSPEPLATATFAAPTAEPSVPDLPLMPEGNFIPKSPHLDYVERLGVKLDITQTIGDYTVRLQYAYADANQIVVVYSVQGPADGFTGVVGNTLVDRDSPAVFAPMFGYADAGDSRSGTYAYFFDASALDQLSSELNLSLTFELGKGTGFGFDLPTIPGVKEESGFSEINQSYYMSDTGDLTLSDLLFPLGQEIVAGPFQFDFTVPVATSETRVEPINQTVEAGGMKITLDKMVVTPGEARMTFSFEAPTGDVTPWQPVLTLQAGDYNSDDAPGDLRVETDSSVGKGTWTYSLIAPLTDKQGEWTVTVTELRAGHEIDLKDGVLGGSGERQTMVGPWTFKFTVPPAQP